MSRRKASLSRVGVSYSREMAGETIDVFLDNLRVWSCTLSGERRLIHWPSALRELLHGSAQGRISDAVTHKLIWEGTVRWSKSGSPDLLDEGGRALRVDKWGRMRPSFETGVDIRPFVARSAAAVLSFLQEQGFNAFIVGGTLLGAIRDGEILPHDDDADLAYLSTHSDPADLVLENHRLHRLLLNRGFRVIRHSWSHLQVLSDDAEADYYVDIFTAFYKSGAFHEPIHVRTTGMDDAILPLSERQLHGVTLAAPRDPEAWLEACYGPSWRTPDPAFVFETPWPTQRRFHAWFGSFYMGINNWKRRYSLGKTPHESSLIRAHVLADADTVIDLGAGHGEDIAEYRRHGIMTVGAEVIEASESVKDGAQLVNLVDYVPAFEFMRTALAHAEGRVIVTANHLFACQDPRGRVTLLELVHFALRRGARVIVADYEELGRYRSDQPRTWHLPWETRTREAVQANLECRLLERTPFTDEDALQRNVAVAEYVLAGEEV